MSLTISSFSFKFRTSKFEYGKTRDWIYGIKLIYRNMLDEEKFVSCWLYFSFRNFHFRNEYLVCEAACLLSSVGGYIGLFFGISIFDLILSTEWILKHFLSLSKVKKWIKKPVSQGFIIRNCKGGERVKFSLFSFLLWSD